MGTSNHLFSSCQRSASNRLDGSDAKHKGRRKNRWKTPIRCAPSASDLKAWCPPTVVTQDLPGGLHAHILHVVVAALLVLFQRTALLVAPATVVALVRLPHCGENESVWSDPQQPTYAISTTSSQQTALEMERQLRKVTQVPCLLPSPVSPTHTPPTHWVLGSISCSH